MKGIIIITIFQLSLFLNIHAGWVIVEHSREPDHGTVTVDTIYIQGNIIKSVVQELTTIFDLNRWTVTFISNTQKGFWSGSPAEYLDFIKEYALDYLENEIMQADEDERPFLQAMYDDLKIDMQMESDAVSFIGELPVELIMTNQQDRLLGYRVNQFLVYVEGIQVEEIWFTREINPGNEYDFEKFRSFADEMSWGNIIEDYRSSEKYIHLMKSGLPLKTTGEMETGSVIITEVLSVARMNIPETEFLPPPGFRPMSLTDLGPVLN